MTINVRALHTTRGTIDLATPQKNWTVASNVDGDSHPLILSNHYNKLYTLKQHQYHGGEYNTNYQIIAVDLWMPTNISEFKPQQLEFLCSLFEHWSDLNCVLVIGFCDESPVLHTILMDLYRLMARYSIPHSRVLFKGHNFAGQETCNAYARHNKLPPLRYIVSWQMLSHLGETNVVDLVQKSSDEYWRYTQLKPMSKSPRSNTFVFLNRRETTNRTALLYILWQKDVAKCSSMISAFPPSQQWHINDRREDYFTHKTKEALQSLVPGEHSKTDIHKFIRSMKLGRLLPGDRDYAMIGGKESRYAEGMTDAYVWLTCESTSELKVTNLFFTEKVLKPMMYGQALVVFAQPGFVKAFKSLGFHTLCEEYGISEQYDTVQDDTERLDMIAQEIIKIGAVPLQKMHEIHLTLEDKINENKKRIWLMLSNISDPDAFVWQAHNSVLSQIHGDKTYNTEQALKMYKDFFDLNKVIE